MWRKLAIMSLGGKCIKCDEKDLDQLHIHHKIPVSDGGSDEPSNLEILCKKHHRKNEIPSNKPFKVITTGLIQVRIEDELEERVRFYTRRKGDLRKIITEALELWLAQKK